jgi:hypothetical protein
MSVATFMPSARCTGSAHDVSGNLDQRPYTMAIGVLPNTYCSLGTPTNSTKRGEGDDVPVGAALTFWGSARERQAA